MVSVNISSYSGLNSKVNLQTVSSLVMCLKRLRFKLDGESTNPDPSQDEDNIDLELGLVTVNSSGTFLADVNVPPGTYDRVEIDLEEDCDGSTTNASLIVNNSAPGSPLSTDDRISIRFEGTFVVSAGNETFNLNIQNIVSALDTATSGSQLRSLAEGVSGSF